MTKFDPYLSDRDGKRGGVGRWSRRDRQHALLAGLAVASLLAASAWALTGAPRDAGSASSRYEAAGFDDRTGNILDTRNSRCRSFDNDTGRMVESSQSESCDALLNRRELTGTARRLDAISKSFLNR
jgi:hypothetical protein